LGERLGQRRIRAGCQGRPRLTLDVDGPAALEPNDDVVDGVSGLALEPGNLQLRGQTEGRTDRRVDEHLHCEPGRHGGLEGHARFGSAAACRVDDLAHVIEIPPDDDVWVQLLGETAPSEAACTGGSSRFPPLLRWVALNGCMAPPSAIYLTRRSPIFGARLPTRAASKRVRTEKVLRFSFLQMPQDLPHIAPRLLHLRQRTQVDRACSRPPRSAGETALPLHRAGGLEIHGTWCLKRARSTDSGVRQ